MGGIVVGVRNRPPHNGQDNPLPQRSAALQQRQQLGAKGGFVEKSQVPTYPVQTRINLYLFSSTQGLS
jgi:hypothetical protein